MASKTNCTINGIDYYRIRKRDGLKLNKDGKWVPNIVSFYGKNKTDAEKKVAEYFAKKKMGINTEEYFATSMNYYVVNVFLKGKNADGTKRRYLGVYNKYIKSSTLNNYKLSEINSKVVQEFFNQLDASYSTMIATRNILKLFFKYAESEGYCKNPMQNIAIGKSRATDNVIVVFTKEEINKIVNSKETGKNAYNRFLFLFALGTGLRQAELLGLKYGDIEEGRIKVVRQIVTGIENNRKVDDTKTDNSVRYVPVPQPLLEQIEKQREGKADDEYIFTGKNGQFLDVSNLIRSYKRFLKSINVPYKEFHTLRRTYATTLCENGVDVATVAELLGNTVEVAAKYYTFVSETRKAKAVSTLDSIFCKKNTGLKSD